MCICHSKNLDADENIVWVPKRASQNFNYSEIITICLRTCNKCTGHLSYGDHSPSEYTVGSNVTLKVETIDDYISSDIILSFGWFYNNIPICVCSCSSHYILGNNNKILTIVNASAADVGAYEARVISYEIDGYSSKLCDRTMSELLEYHAVVAPVTYTLGYKGKTMKQSQKFN